MYIYVYIYIYVRWSWGRIEDILRQQNLYYAINMLIATQCTNCFQVNLFPFSKKLE